MPKRKREQHAVRSVHSRAEARWTAGVCQLLRPDRDVTVDDMLRAMRDGDACGLSDGAVDDTVFEYDEVHFHTNVARDVRKTAAIAARAGVRTILRLRRGCDPFRLDLEAGAARVVFVCTDSHNTVVQLRITAEALELPFDELRARVAVVTGDRAFDDVDARTVAAIAFLTSRYGAFAARILKVTGVRSRLWKPELCQALDDVRRNLCGDDVRTLCTFLHPCLIAAITGPAAGRFWDGVRALKGEFCITDKALVTFMKGSVAAVIAGPGAERFWDGLRKLNCEFGITGKALVTFMKCSVAAAIAGPGAERFWDGLRTLKSEFSITDKALVTFMNSSAAVAIAGPGAERFWDGLCTLKCEFSITGNALVTFMSNSVASAIAGPGVERFWDGLRTLKGEFGITGKALVTFMNNSVAVAIAGPGAERFWDGLCTLKGEFGITDKALVTFVQGGVAAAIAGPSAERFWDGLRALKGEFGITGKALVTFTKGGVAAAIAGPGAERFWGGLPTFNDAGIDVLSIMCDGVASRISSPSWADAVIGVLRLTSTDCVRNLVYTSSTVALVQDVHARLLGLPPSEREHFAQHVCVGEYSVKIERVRAWLT